MVIYPKQYKVKRKKPVLVVLALILLPLYLLHLIDGVWQYNQKVIQTQYELQEIDKQIAFCESKLKKLRKLRQEKENLLVVLTY